MFQLPLDGTGETTWVLMVTPSQGSPAGGNGVVALTGSFDGKAFIADPVSDSTTVAGLQARFRRRIELGQRACV